MTLSTLDRDFSTENGNTQILLSDALHYLGWSLFLALFGAVYEIFSHEVYSYWMIYAFAVPLTLGVLPCLVLALRFRVHCYRRLVEEPVRSLYHAGVITLSVGSVMQGVLAIYGTTNRLMKGYGLFAFILFLAALLTAVRRPGTYHRPSV